MGELRGAKRDTWEGGHRVPFLARWPGQNQPGQRERRDDLPCRSHGDRRRAARGTHCRPMRARTVSTCCPCCCGEKLDRPVREATVHHSGSGKFAIRKGDWVLIDAARVATTTARGANRSGSRTSADTRNTTLPGELFDLHDDLPERRNQFAEQPEIVPRAEGTSGEIHGATAAVRQDRRNPTTRTWANRPTWFPVGTPTTGPPAPEPFVGKPVSAPGEPACRIFCQHARHGGHLPDLRHGLRGRFVGLRRPAARTAKGRAPHLPACRQPAGCVHRGSGGRSRRAHRHLDRSSRLIRRLR